ncbi:MAG: HAD family hydrolase [Vallitalea sp.]|jgi:FMN phosphatase YigB (HAD superfamily)|nr:HAD family hydrolase [Vallitalea sp.]
MNTFLFDLDGTLLPLDDKLFLKTYFDEMHKEFEDIIEKEQLVKLIWTATDVMRCSQDNRTNMKTFMDKFKELVSELGNDLSEYITRFDKFYDNGFMKVKKSASQNEYVIKSIELLKDKGYTVVVATNPLFPMKAVHHRIKWAGLNPEDFYYITSYENSHSCKPYISYYEEILEFINKQPQDCIMVGNDVQEDLVASELGIKTFLIEDYIINRNEAEICCNYKGSYKDLYNYIEKLPSIK